MSFKQFHGICAGAHLYFTGVSFSRGPREGKGKLVLFQGFLVHEDN